MEFRYRDGDTKCPAHLQPTSSFLGVSLRRRPRPTPTESAQHAQLQYSSISHPQPRPTEVPYRLRNERLQRSSSSTIGVLVDSTSKETGRSVIRRTVPALQGDIVEEQLEDLISREQVMRRPVSALTPLQRGLISREIERPLHVLHHPMSTLGHMQRREMVKERIRRELRKQIRDEMVEEEREYAEMRRVLEEEVRQELDMKWARGVGQTPLVMQPPHQPVEMGETMGNPQVSMDEQLSVTIRPSPDVTPSPYFPTESFQLQAGDQHDTTSQINHIAVSRNELALVHSDCNFEKGEHIAEAKMSNWETPGIKRHGVGIMESGSKKLRTDDESWTCAVCQVTVTSEKHLDSHLQGKKHKTRVEKFTLEESLIKKSDASSASTPDNTPKSTLLQAQDGEKVTMKADGKSHKVIIKRDSVWCEACMAVCNTREMMVIHLKGKKHIQRMKKLNITEDEAN